MQRTVSRGWRFVLVALALLPALVSGLDSAGAAQVSGTTYASPLYGYTITWGAPFVLVNQEVDGSAERLSLGDDLSFVYLTASNEFSTAANAAEAFAGFVQNDEDYSNVIEIPAPRCTSPSSLPPAVTRCYQYDRVFDSGAVGAEGLLLQTWDLGNNVTMIMLASVALSSFDRYLPLFGQILITPAGSTGIPLSPTATAIAGATSDWGGTNSRVPTETGTSSGTLTDDNIHFSFEAGVSDSDRNDAVEGTRLGQAVIGSFVGTDGLDNVNIVVSAAESSSSPYILATTRGQEITVYTGSPAWQEAPSLIRVETLVHELMHVYQNALERSSNTLVPLWFDEGTAEALGYLAITQLGVVDQNDIYDLNLYLLTRFPVDGSLENLEPYDSMNADSYPLAYIAVQYLLGRGGMSVSALTAVYEGIRNGHSFDSAFASVFGMTPDQFYDEFDQWRTGLLQVPAAPIDFMTPPSTGQAAPASWQQVQGTVERGDQLLLAVLSQPGASCTAEVRLPGTPIQRTAATNGNGEAYWLITIPETAPAGAISVDANCGGPEVTQMVTVS